MFKSLIAFLVPPIGKKTEADRNKYKSVAIDIFIFFKWAGVIIPWIFGISNSLVTILVFYLLFLNVFSYFYNHIWCVSRDLPGSVRSKRRFISLMLAILYSLVGFGYLYALPISTEYTWTSGHSHAIQALLFSIASAFTASFNDVVPITDKGSALALIEVLVTAVFLTIIISNSLPVRDKSSDSIT